MRHAGTRNLLTRQLLLALTAEKDVEPGLNNAQWIPDYTHAKQHLYDPRRHNMQRDFYVIIERDEDGFFVGEVPALKACYAQGKTIDEMLKNIKEVIDLCLENQQEVSNNNIEFIGVQKVTINDNLAHA